MLNLINSVFGQVKSNTYYKWYLKPAGGINIPITNLLSGEITDNLFSYSDHSYYLQFLSGNFFFSQKWGVEFTFQACASNSIYGGTDRFSSEIHRKYDKDYFVSPSTSEQNGLEYILTENFGRGYLGVVYRIEKPKYILLPKLFIGVTSFFTNWGSADLKEKGTNTVMKISYSSGAGPNHHFTLAPGFSFGYRISKRVIANIDFIYSYYKTNIEFVEETRNTFTDETSYNTIDYRKNIHTLTIGIGLIIELRPAPNKTY